MKPTLTLALLTLAACDAERPPVDCNLMAVASVIVHLSIDGAPYTGDAAVAWTDGDRDEDCVSLTDGRWACGYEVAGTLTIAVLVDGYAPVQRQVVVAAGECSVLTETLDVALQPRPASGTFDEDRVWFVRLFEDDDDCANSWERFEMNCHQVATFCADGSFEIVVTDIVNYGTYTLDGATVQTANSGDDVPDDLAFELQEDGTLVDDAWEETWTEDLDGLMGNPCP